MKEETDNEGWIDWQGGECPVNPKVEVEYRMRNGHSHKRLATSLRWSHRGSSGDITSYRIVEEDSFAELKKAYKEGKRIQLKTSVSWKTLNCKLRWGHPATKYRIHPDDVDLLNYTPVSAVLPTINTTQPKEEKAMKSIKIESQTNIVIDGVSTNAANSSDEHIFKLIANMEKEVEKLGEIKNKPKKLEAEIKRMQDEIKALVAYVDSRETK